MRMYQPTSNKVNPTQLIFSTTPISTLGIHLVCTLGFHYGIFLRLNNGGYINSVTAQKIFKIKITKVNEAGITPDFTLDLLLLQATIANSNNP
jgi:hypothetical protein